MEKTIKITQSPFAPALEVVDDICIKLHAPYSENDVTIKVDTAITEYKEVEKNNGIEIRQLMETRDTEITQTIKLDLKDNNEKSFNIESKDYNVKLLGIDKENIEGQEFPRYEFLVTT